MSKFISLSELKTLLEPLVHLINKKAESWDDLKNKPFYEAKKEIALIDQEISSPTVNLSATLVEGETYTIIWDGIEYTSVARNYDGWLMVGNNALYEYDYDDSTDTGEPFALEVEEGTTAGYFYISEDDTSPTHTVKILGNKITVKKIDKKYLPDNLATKDYVDSNIPEISIDTIIDSTSRNPVESRAIYDSFQNVDNTLNEHIVQINNKVDKIDGKGLSTNDYTNAYKNKLSSTNIAFGVCDTASDVAQKIVTLESNSNWKRTKGSVIMVYFSSTNTASAPSLNVNDTGASNIVYNAGYIAANKLHAAGVANKVLTYMFNGSYYYLIGSGDIGVITTERTFSVLTTGWTYNDTYGAYSQVFTADGATPDSDIYIDCPVGANFPLIGARCLAENKITLYMSECPTVAETVSVKFKREK